MLHQRMVSTPRQVVLATVLLVAALAHGQGIEQSTAAEAAALLYVQDGDIIMQPVSKGA